MPKTLRFFFIIPTLLLLVAGRLDGASVTVAWDANSETNIASYKVSWGTQSGVYTSSASAGTATSYPVPNLPVGFTYYFVVQAINTEGLISPMSTEVNVTIPGPTGETQAQWMARFGITDMAADTDGDGVTNLNEFLAGTDPRLPNTWFLAEGHTGYFKARLAIANPGTDTAQITATFLRDGAPPIVQQYTIPGQSRQTIRLNDIPGLETASVSTQITTQRGGVIVERTMTWGGTGSMDTAHTGKALASARPAWYFAEGEARLFDTYLLLANSNAFPVTVDVLYMLDSGTVVHGAYTLPASSRYTVYTNDVPGVGGTSFSMTVLGSAPIVAERAMYFSTLTEWWKGGTDSAGADSLATQWFIAEGRTGAGFAEYILLSNPNGAATTVTIRYLRPTGPVITQTYQLAATSRATILVNQIAGLENTAVSASITSTLPIIAERSLYWPGRWGQWYEGHNSVALSEIGTLWGLAEGEAGGPNNVTSYILLANPGNQDASVTLTVLRTSQPPLTLQRTLPANSRLTVDSTELGLTSGERFGAVVESTNGVPIAVERSMYWDASGLHWSAGTNETGIRIR